MTSEFISYAWYALILGRYWGGIGEILRGSVRLVKVEPSDLTLNPDVLLQSVNW